MKIHAISIIFYDKMIATNFIAFIFDINSKPIPVLSRIEFLAVIVVTLCRIIYKLCDRSPWIVSNIFICGVNAGCWSNINALCHLIHRPIHY